MWSDSFCEGLGPTIGSSSISLSCSMLLVLCLWWLIITFNDRSWSIFGPDVSKLLVLVVDWCMKKRGFLWDSADKKHSRSWHDSSSSASLLLSLNVKRLMSKNSNDESETPSSLLHHWLSLLAVSSKSLLVVACRYLNLLADLLVLKTFVSKIVLLFCLWMKLLATMNNLWKQIINSITLCYWCDVLPFSLFFVNFPARKGQVNLPCFFYTQERNVIFFNAAQICKRVVVYLTKL